MTHLLAGFSEIDFTPELGLELRGQHYRRVAERVRDPLMASAMALRSGDETVVLVSVDVCFLCIDFVTEVQGRFSARTGIAPGRLLVHATHSHVAPITEPYFWGTADPVFLESLREAVAEVARQAVDRLEPVTAFSGAGTLDYLGWNRRGMFADGSSAMHADPRRPDFVGSEGTRDPTLSVLFARNASGSITGVVASFSTHPNCVDDQSYYSADLPGEVRRLLKLMLGDDVRVVYLTGPAGNVTPRILEPYSPDQPWMREQGLRRSGLYMAGEAAKVIASTIEPITKPEFRVEHSVVPIPMRPYPRPGEPCYPSFWSDESKEYYLSNEADWPRRMREESPVDVRLNVVRIGDTAICTDPAELFVEFGLKIREASPARVTIIPQLTDGYAGYIPTPLAFSRGGYETWPARTSRLVPEAGDMIADATVEMLQNVFADR